MIQRFQAANLRRALEIFPVVGLIGPRQVGKTTLALHLRDLVKTPTVYLDLELDSDLARLQEAEPLSPPAGRDARDH